MSALLAALPSHLVSAAMRGVQKVDTPVKIHMETVRKFYWMPRPDKVDSINAMRGAKVFVYFDHDLHEDFDTSCPPAGIL